MTTDLQVVKYGDQLVVDSRQVAEMVGKPHNDLMKSIRQYTEYLGQGDFPQSDFSLNHPTQIDRTRNIRIY